MREVTAHDPAAHFAIDPGLVTGVACFSPQGGGFRSVEVPGGDIAFARFWREVLHKNAVLSIVTEKFVITNATTSKTRQYDALYINGWLRLECDALGIPLTMQTPAEGKSFGTDAKLRYLGWFDRSPGGHKNDAARHLVTYLSTRDEMIRSALARMAQTAEDQGR